MSTTTTSTPSASKTASQLAYLTRALRAPAIRDSLERLADTARQEGWSHEEYLAAVLGREVAAREAHGAEARIRRAGLPARKTLEEFDFAHAPDLDRELVVHLAMADFVAAKSNVVLLGPPGRG
jgi:DNA replication protein DnaC